jgi:hypothetical protein
MIECNDAMIIIILLVQLTLFILLLSFSSLCGFDERVMEGRMRF